jgi:hypothetical protein
MRRARAGGHPVLSYLPTCSVYEVGPHIPFCSFCLLDLTLHRWLDLVLTFKPMLLSHPDYDWLVDREERKCRKVLEFMVENLKRILDDRPVWH